jgi:hypothetical protein
MSSSAKRRQTMAKMNRERAVKEKRALKAERKEERKAAAAAELLGPVAEEGVAESEEGAAEDEAAADERPQPGLTAAAGS